MFFLGALVAAYLAGRYGAPDSEKMKKENTTLTTEIANLKKQLSESSDHQRASEQTKTVLSIDKKDGDRITLTKYEAKRASNSQTTKDLSVNQSVQTQTDSKTVEEKEIKNRRGGVFSLHAIVPLNSFSTSPVYGATFTVPVMGPIHAGVDLFTDLRVGISLGWGF